MLLSKPRANNQSINQSITLFVNSTVTQVNNERNMAVCQNRQKSNKADHLKKENSYSLAGKPSL